MTGLVEHMVSLSDQQVNTVFQVLLEIRLGHVPRSPVSTSKTGRHQLRIHDATNFHHKKNRTPSLIYWVSLPAGKKRSRKDELQLFYANMLAPPDSIASISA
jgi:hypothetical protein